MSAAIETTDVTKVYGVGDTRVVALGGVSFRAETGDFVAIMGPSGSGKSTLLHILGALETPTGGSVAMGEERYVGLDDRALTRLRRERLGFVFQFFNLLPSLTAIENVLLPALIARRRDDGVVARGRALLERVGLGGRAEHTPAELSGGEQQRVSIARALVLSPEVLLADEPTGNLDTRSGREVLGLLRSLTDDEGRTIVMVTHDPAAAAVADRVVYLRDGLLVAEEPGGSVSRIAERLASLTADEGPHTAAAPSAAPPPPPEDASRRPRLRSIGQRVRR
jgi:putative ABC transport system ATP-binding protein